MGSLILKVEMIEFNLISFIDDAVIFLF